MARIQYFPETESYDVNRRMGRFMMNGILLYNGYPVIPVINVPAKRKLEFNEKMLAFYESNNPASMQAFLISCLDERILKIMAQ